MKNTFRNAQDVAASLMAARKTLPSRSVVRAFHRSTIGFLGVALMATQLIGAVNTGEVRFQTPSSIAFEQAAPATPAQKEVAKLLKQISSNAAVTGRHAEKLESFTRGSQLAYETHAAELTRAKEAINSMGSDFRRLQELRSSALPWQQTLIDRLHPVLVGMAGQATEAFERLNQDRGRIQSQEYREVVGNLYAHAGQAQNLIAVHLDYAQAREKLNRLDASSVEPVAQVVPREALPQSEAPLPAPKAAKSLEQQVRSALLKLPYYGVFDHLTFQVDGDQVTLNGQVNWPTLKTDAERVVRSVEGVAALHSNIEVLPTSPNDDRIRIRAYWAIYGHSTLARYRLNPNPPIRIIVKDGNLTLKGVVGSDMDRTIAHVQANSVPGVFSVTNHLQVDG
ncbi:MAG TPA: BON domain-containing protein [Bryobacteraceae bacterium]|nr:BON domain-containing protein [Bryobacteraceae bacterium]